jgi:long-chain fatty acid transport protein
MGFNVGIVWHAATTVRLGVHYRSGIDHDLSGSATTSGLTGPLTAFNGTVDASTGIDLPAVAAAGFAFEPVDSRFVLYGDYTWYSWGDLETINIELAGGLPGVERPQGFRDTYSLALGGDFTLSERVTLRGGVKHDRTPTTNGFRDTAFADDDRLWIAVGGTYAPSSRFTIDFALVHLFIDETSVDVTRTFFDATPLASSVRTRAHVDSVSNNLAVGFRWSF